MIYLFSALVTLLGGILAASSIIISKKPDARELIAKLIPFQGAIGIAMLILGGFETIGLLGDFKLILFAKAFVDLGLGFLLGFSLLNRWFLSKDLEMLRKAENLKMKMVKYEINAGVVAIGIGILFLIKMIFHI